VKMTRVYIGHLSYRVRERDLEKFFRGFGKIREVLLKNGFGFVEFDDDRDADDAVYELNGRELDGERYFTTLGRRAGSRNGTPRPGCAQLYGHVSNCFRLFGRATAPVNRYGPPTRTDYRVIIENLSSRISWQDLKDRMRQVGDVTYADAHRRKRNEGVVEFASYSDMRRAIDKLDNTELNGRRIRVIEEKPIRSRRRSRTRSPTPAKRSRRSRSASASRSRSRTPRRAHSRSPRRSRSGSRRSRRGSSDSHSKSPVAKRKSHSRSRTPKKQKAASRSRSRSASNRKQLSRSRSRSASNKKRQSRSRSRSATNKRRVSRSRSRSASKKKRQSRSRSRSASTKKRLSRSRSRSASNR
ncbi:alternative splicing factor SRp55/B52/SRp75, putative, partial [Ixodes scapularis]